MQREIIQALAFSIPAIGAMVCMAVMLMDVFHPGKDRQARQLRLFLMLTYAVAALCWAGLVLQVAIPKAFVYYQPVFFFTLMMDQVLIFRFVHLITSVRSSDRFSLLHFAVPVVLTILMTVSMMVIPYEKRLAILYDTGDDFENRWYAVLNSLSGMVFVCYNILYPVLGLYRIRRYRRVIVNYSADTQRTSLNWLYIMQILTLITIPVPLAGLLLNLEIFSNFWSSMQGVLPTFIVYPILCYNLLSDNYEIMRHDDASLPDRLTGDESDSGKLPAIDPKRFDKYLKDKQPYTNPKIHVSDFANALHTNSKYVSAYINNTYGMSFSRFVNRCRLDELVRLRKSPQMKPRDNMELILMAGFSNYQSYLRAKKVEYKEQVLKDFE